MKSALQHRVAQLETAALRERASRSGRVTLQSFREHLERRMRLKREDLETAFQAVVVDLDDDALDALLAQAETSLAPQEMEPE